MVLRQLSGTASLNSEHLLPVFLPERLDLDVHAGRQVELHQRVDRLRRGLEDVDQPLVRADLELLARLLVDVRRAQDGLLVASRSAAESARDRAPVRLAVSTISLADWSSIR